VLTLQKEVYGKMRLIGNSKFILLAVVLIVGSLWIGYNAPQIDYKFDTFNISIENFTVPRIDLPAPDSPFNADNPPQFKTFAQELSWYSQLKEDCNGCDRTQITSVTNCDVLVRDYKQNPDNPLKPTLALHILDVCEI
jgi:hypothetical protein